MGAGHSLGEFSALVAAGSIDYSAAILLVRERGRLMKEAGEKFRGMVMILGVDDDRLAEICEEASDHGVIVIANANCPGQTVISEKSRPWNAPWSSRKRLAPNGRSGSA
ncbi:MAG: acyltransferase domain-containing protein [Thermomicrobiales bacterium]